MESFKELFVKLEFHDDIIYECYEYSTLDDLLKYASKEWKMNLNRTNLMYNYNDETFMIEDVIKLKYNEIQATIKKLKDDNKYDADHFVLNRDPMKTEAYLVNFDVNCTNSHQKTPLYNSLRMNYTDNVKILMENGASVEDLNIGFGLKNIDSFKVILPYIDANEHLLNILNGRSVECLELLIKNNVNLDIKFDMKFSPLYVAVENGNGDMAEMLIKNGANVDIASLYLSVINDDLESFILLEKFIDYDREDIINIVKRRESRNINEYLNRSE